MPVSVISQSELEGLWQQNGIPAKRLRGLFNEIIADSRSARNPVYPGGVSLIVKLITPRGQHIGSVHEVRMPDGSTPHSHPKDYTRRDCSRVRA